MDEGLDAHSPPSWANLRKEHVASHDGSGPLSFAGADPRRRVLGISADSSIARTGGWPCSSMA